MKLNEDGTITLSQRETQKFITKIITPEYKRQKSYRSFKKRHSVEEVKELQKIIRNFQEFWSQNKNIPSKASLTRFMNLVNWYLGDREVTSGICSDEEFDELEKAFNLYKMLMKHRRYTDE